MRMKTFKTLLLALLLNANADAARPPTAHEITPEDFYRQAIASPPKQVSAKQLADWLADDAVVLIDLRGKESFDHAHIRGAINVPIEALTLENLKSLVPNNNARIVVYCANNFGMTRMISLTTLGYPSIQQLGYSNVYRLEDLWRSETCRASEKLKAHAGQVSKSAGGCESLLPMDRVKK